MNPERYAKEKDHLHQQQECVHSLWQTASISKLKTVDVLEGLIPVSRATKDPGQLPIMCVNETRPGAGVMFI